MSISCPYCHSERSEVSGSRSVIVSSGYFIRKVDQSRHRRFLCRPCKKSFSTTSRDICYRQKKRHLNPKLFELLVSGVSQRRAAFLLKTNRKTIVAKFLFLGLCASKVFAHNRASEVPVTGMEFDDLETFEHSKMKPLSVIMAVESGTRRILGFRVARMPAKGLLAKRSRAKYGFRKDERRQKREDLFRELIPFVATGAIIKSDESPHYPFSVRDFFKGCTHKTFKGRKGCVVGQGELKSGGFDPIFALNHTFAMARANINRLFRRTWNTTKIPERLSVHFGLYALYHNLYLIKHPKLMRVV